ncbi:MAG TPA: DUF2922 family protein [Enterococcus aquimarinus]|nr:DUF2922 family protein [Enterococcus aquimarinus]
MKKLHLTFLNQEGKKHKLIPKIASTELTAEEVEAAIDSAKYVETIETPLFNK